MAKFLITQDIADAGEVKKFTFRIRDMYEKYTTEVTVKASSVQEAKQKVKAQLIGWANFVIMRVWDETGATYYGRDLINFKDNQTVVEDGVYNIFANENDKDYLKSALKEMNRYLDSWEQLSMKMRRDIAPGGKSELKEHIKNAQARLAQLNDSQTVKDYGEFENIEFESFNDNYSNNEVLFKYSELNGVQRRNINGQTELNFGGDWYKLAHMRMARIGSGVKYFARMQKIRDARVNDGWGGSYNGATYNYSNGQWTITHKNGKVETIPGDKFDKIEEIYAYIDNFKDSKIIDKQLTYELIENEQEANAFAQKHNGTATPYKTADGSFNGFIVWYKDSNSIQDANTCFVIATKNQDEWYTGDANHKFSYALKSVKKFDTRQQAEQEAQNVLGANWRDKYGVFEINSNLGAYTSMQWKPKDASWAETTMQELMKKGKENWDEDDWEAYHYIKQIEGENRVDDSVEITKESGTDKIIYVMQSDIDDNLYFYIGKNYSMKDGEWTYAKFKMNGTTPEQLKSELEKVGWHQVNNGPANIIDSKEGFENYLDVYDANYSEDVNHTADYLWTWTHNGREEVASKLFDEQLYKYNTKEEAIQHIDEIYKNARKEFEDFYRQLKVVVNKRLEDGYKMNLQALEQRRNRLKK